MRSAHRVKLIHAKCLYVTFFFKFETGLEAFTWQIPKNNWFSSTLDIIGFLKIKQVLFHSFSCSSFFLFIFLDPGSLNCLELFSQTLAVNQAHLFCLMLLVEWNLLTSFHPVILIHLMSAANDLLRFRENYILIYLRSKLHCKHKRFTLQTILILFKI